MTTKAMTSKHCAHCSPNVAYERSIVEPILTMTRTEVVNLSRSWADRTPMLLEFRCRMCDRSWHHRVDVRFSK